MPKMNREALKELRQKKKQEMDTVNGSTENTYIFISLGTCGIAAGGEDALDAFNDEIEKRNLENIVIKQTGCMGYCSHEPTVEIRKPGMPTVVYGYVDDKIARKIVDRHLINERLVNDHVLDKPAVDIVE